MISLEERVNKLTNLKLVTTGNMYFTLHGVERFHLVLVPSVKLTISFPIPERPEWWLYFILTQIPTSASTHGVSILQWLPEAQKDCLKEAVSINYGLDLRIGGHKLVLDFSKKLWHLIHKTWCDTWWVWPSVILCHSFYFPPLIVFIVYGDFNECLFSVLMIAFKCIN